MLPDLFDHQIDIAFQSGQIADSSLVIRRVATALAHLRSTVVPCPPRYPQTPEDLAQHDCLNYLPGTKLSQWPLQEASQLNIHAPLGRVAADSGDVVCSLTIAGMGLARLLRHALLARCLRVSWCQCSMPISPKVTLSTRSSRTDAI